MQFSDNLRVLGARLRTFTAGGSWSNQLAPPVQRNLRWFYFDGVFAASSEAVSLTYLTLYVLALGATRQQIGWMTALANLSAVLLLLPGAMLVDRTGKRKMIVLIAGGIISRVMLLGLALLPFFLEGNPAVVTAIGLKLVSDGFANLGLPAWVSMTADVVPYEWRGRYFGTRNLAMGVASMTTIYLIGQLITGTSSPQGYQLSFFIAFLVGMASTFAFSRLKEPPMAVSRQAAPGYSAGSVLGIFRQDRNFLAFCLYILTWNFSLTIAGPFFSVYMVQDLNASAVMVGVLSIVSSLSSLPAQRYLGHIADRWGPYRLMKLMSFTIPILPLAWLLVNEAWQAIPINILGGVLWAGYSLASFNFLLIISPAEQRARYSAIFQIFVALSNAAGAALGGVIAAAWGIPLLFLISGLGRLAAAVVLHVFVRTPSDSLETGAAVPA